MAKSGVSGKSDDSGDSGGSGLPAKVIPGPILASREVVPGPIPASRRFPVHETPPDHWRLDDACGYRA